MYAIVDIVGQQFKVVKDQKLFVHRLQDKEGSKVSFGKVYLLDDGKKVTVGAPAIIGAAVEAKVVGHLKGDKVIVFKKKRRKGYRVKNGHRQALTELIVEKIVASGAKTLAAKPRAVKPSEPAEAPAAEKTLAKKEQKPKSANAPTAKKTPVKVDVEDYSKMVVAELKAIAKKKGIVGYKTLKKAELILALSK